MNSLLCFTIFLSVVSIQGQGRLEPTKLINNQSYRLRNQNDGRVLADAGNGTPIKAQETGESNQSFTFINTSSGSDMWMLVSLRSKVPLSDTIWKVSYGGHGKYIFQNTRTGMCLTGGVEAVCKINNPSQRWFPEPVKN